MANIDVSWIGLENNIRLGVRFIELKVVYETGEFELRFPIREALTTEEHLREMIRDLLCQFGIELAGVDKSHIHIPPGNLLP